MRLNQMMDPDFEGWIFAIVVVLLEGLLAIGVYIFLIGTWKKSARSSCSDNSEERNTDSRRCVDDLSTPAIQCVTSKQLNKDNHSLIWHTPQRRRNDDSVHVAASNVCLGKTVRVEAQAKETQTITAQCEGNIFTGVPITNRGTNTSEDRNGIVTSTNKPYSPFTVSSKSCTGQKALAQSNIYKDYDRQRMKTETQSNRRRLQLSLDNATYVTTSKQHGTQVLKTKTSTEDSRISKLISSSDFKKDVKSTISMSRSSDPFNYTKTLTASIKKTVVTPKPNVTRTKSQSPVPARQRHRSHKYNRYENRTMNETYFNIHRSLKKPYYNACRRKMFKRTELNSEYLETVQQFYYESVKVDTMIKVETQHYINKLLKRILRDSDNGNRFDVYANEEGSVAVGLKVGKADESDHSVEIRVDTNLIHLSDEPFRCEYMTDDIDNYFIEEPTVFVDAGKRFFPDEYRELIKKRKPPEIQNGFVAVSIGKKDSSRFRNCCISTRGCKWLLPYPLLWEFHHFVDNVVYDFDYVTLNKAARGPAITLTIKQNGGPNIAVDITLKLTLSSETLSVIDFSWPRYDTRKWLTEEKIDQVTSQPIYLVPKGDKYWKVSFANCEFEILKDIDGNGTWRKACLRIMKRKFIQWQSKSANGLKGLSSYLLKTTLLWMSEILPDDRYWFRDQLANRYLNFLQEFSTRLKKRRIGEYFNPSVNLLADKDEDCIDELIDLLDEEMASLGIRC